MNIRTTLITNSQPTKLMQPGKRAFHYPPSFAQPATVRCSTLGQQRFDLQNSQSDAVWLRIIGTITLNNIRTLTRSATPASYWWNCFNQREKLCHIVAISTGNNGSKRYPVGVGNYMMLTAVFASIGGVWTRFLPPKTARTDAESTTAREKSILLAFRSLLSKIRCILSQTPAFCQSRSLRQHVMPEPHPISLGKCSQPIPVLSTNRIPIKTVRSGIDFRPGYRNRLFFFGSIGSINFHNSSSKIGFAMSNLLVISFWLLMLSAINVKILSFC